MSRQMSPVEVVCTSGPLPLVAQGRTRQLPDGSWEVNLDQDASHLPVGARTILSFTDPEQPRVIADIVQVSGNRILCRQRMVRERERRAFPRLVGGLPIRYRVLSATEERGEGAAWLADDDGPLSRGTWHEPDELMNFSVTGLRFEGSEDAQEGNLLLLELGVRGYANRWRTTARVVRTFPLSEEEKAQGRNRSIAVSFEEIPEEAEAALSEMTLNIQEALLQPV